MSSMAAPASASDWSIGLTTSCPLRMRAMCPHRWHVRTRGNDALVAPTWLQVGQVIRSSIQISIAAGGTCATGARSVWTEPDSGTSSAPVDWNCRPLRATRSSPPSTPNVRTVPMSHFGRALALTAPGPFFWERVTSWQRHAEKA